MERHEVVFIVTGMCTVICVLSSVILICQHLWSRGPASARTYTVRILLMAPVYCLQAYGALLLRLTWGNLLLEFGRKAYECIVIFAFVQLLVFHLGGFPCLCARLRPEDCHHLPPLRWFLNAASWTPAERFVRRTLSLVWFYVPTTMFAATCALIAGLCADAHIETISKVTNLVIGVCQCGAMYGLLTFYHANQVALAPIKPLAKLLTIKTMLLFTIWQSIIVHYLNKIGVFKPFAAHSQSHWNDAEIGEGVLNVLLIGEMVLLALSHHCVFPPGEAAAVLDSCEGGGSGGGGEEELVACDGRANGCGEVLVRFCQVFNFRDIPAYDRDLREHARTVSTDNLSQARASRRCGPCLRSHFVYICCRFLQGAPAEERACQHAEIDIDVSTSASTGSSPSNQVK
jgi:hypothetical protein